ncbi:MAG: tetratricopeptide repeat protein [Cyanobacteria bacterium]|nr:tetratricopeptide repeat protein [Cyanobacteriota bacterium]
MLDTYDQGRYDEAVAKAAALTDLGPLRLRFVQDSPLWVNAEPARVERRLAVAAAFLLEVTGARLESDWGRFSDLIEWSCVQMRSAAQPTEFERAWHAASHALAGRAGVRGWMLGVSPRLAHQKPAPERKLQPNERPPATHLMHALERFPDDPHFPLSRIVAWTWGRDEEPMRNVRTRERDDDDRAPPARRKPQLEAVVALEPLTAMPEVATEAWIRLGLVHFTVGDFASALRAFESAQPIATDTSMKYLAFFNAGRALEGLKREDDAMRAYQRALAVIPDAGSATVALTSLQFMRDDRDAAVSSIDRVFNRTPAPVESHIYRSSTCRNLKRISRTGHSTS